MEQICKLCGANMYDGAFGNYLSYCSDHDAKICPVCCFCNGVEPTDDVLESSKERRKIWETYFAPIMKEMKKHGRHTA